MRNTPENAYNTCSIIVNDSVASIECIQEALSFINSEFAEVASDFIQIIANSGESITSELIDAMNSVDKLKFVVDGLCMWIRVIRQHYSSASQSKNDFIT